MNDQYTDELAKDYFKMNELIIKLQQENKQLKELVDKIIDYCENELNETIDTINSIEKRKILNNSPELYLNQGYNAAIKNILNLIKEYENENT